MEVPDVMWLPKPIYNALPTIYIVVGLLLASGVIYIGLERSGAIYYLLLAALCIAAGLIVQWLRSRPARSSTSAGGGTDPSV